MATGYVTKCGGSVRSWKKRWMVLKDGTIFYYTNEKAKAPKGTLELEADDSAHAVRNSDKSPFMFGINTTKRTYLMCESSWAVCRSLLPLTCTSRSQVP